MIVLQSIGHALQMAFTMFWDIFWGLNLGFVFSAVVEQIVSKDELSRLLPDAGPRSIAIASGLGAASSSCSYAAVAMARSMVRKGADFTAAMAFQFAATNLVLEIGVLLIATLGWQFGVAEFVGGPIMILLLVILYRGMLKPDLTRGAIAQANRNVAGAMEGHAAMAMAKQQGGWRDRLLTRDGIIAISHGFVMNWAMLWKDILAGVLVAGALAAWVPHSAWQALFLTEHPVAASIWGAFLGPLIAMASFTCSVGNIPFAAVLWRGGISFGGVIAFIFGDLIIPPILNIYRKYYGGKMTIFLLVTFYGVMVAAALLVEGIFSLLHLVPAPAAVGFLEQGVTLNYTGYLNLLFGVAAVGLYLLYRRTGGPAMMQHMAGRGSPEHDHEHERGREHEHEHEHERGREHEHEHEHEHALEHRHGHDHERA